MAAPCGAVGLGAYRYYLVVAFDKCGERWYCECRGSHVDNFHACHPLLVQ